MEPTQEQSAPAASSAAPVNPEVPAAKPAATLGRKLYKVAWWIVSIALVVVGLVQIYGGIQSIFFLPDCDSKDAKDRLSNAFKEHNYAPLRYDSIKTVSTSKDEVVCNAVLPLPDGANLIADYTYYWEGKSSMLKYSIHRKMP
jgi:hypothetical protein